MISLNPTTPTSGSGIDVTSVVNQLLDAARAPERIWQDQQTQLSLAATSLTSINTGLSTLAEKVNALRDILGALTSKTVTSSQANIATATADPSAVSGIHTLVVNNLASTGSFYSEPVASSSTPLGLGTLSLNVGGAPAQDIVVDSSNNTLDGLTSYINSRDFGVNASLLQDLNGARLVLVSKTSGSAGDLLISANSSSLVLQHSATGLDASFTLDSVPLNSATNTAGSILPGVTLNLLAAAPQTPVILNIGPDAGAVTQAINDFVSSYNSVMTAINNQFAVSGSSNTAGPLASNSSLRALQSSLLADVTFSVSGNSSFVNLASLGINMANDGTLSVDNSALSTAISSHFSDFQSFFQSLGSGFATHFSTDLQSLTDSTAGVLNLELTQNKSNQSTLTHQINDLEDRLVVRQQELVKEYSQIDALLRQTPLILAQIQAQLGYTTSTK